MKKLLLPLALIVAFHASAIESINAIIGDTSYLEKYGELPTSETDDADRIKTHLEYVEKRLRETSEVLLTDEKLRNRNKVLDYLQEYTKRQQFPELPVDFGSRQPCFIDDNGVECAVAYLISRTRGKSIAEAINNTHRFEYLLYMNDPILDQWAEAFGLSLRELAMVQPTYAYKKYYQPVSPPEPLPAPELSNEAKLRMQLQNLQVKYANLSHENEEKRIRIEEQNGVIAEKDAVISGEKARNEALQNQMQEDRETFNGEIKKKKKWNIALGGIATALTSITVFQWIKIRNAG